MNTVDRRLARPSAKPLYEDIAKDSIIRDIRDPGVYRYPEDDYLEVLVYYRTAFSGKKLIHKVVRKSLYAAFGTQIAKYGNRLDPLPDYTCEDIHKIYEEVVNREFNAYKRQKRTIHKSSIFDSVLIDHNSCPPINYNDVRVAPTVTVLMLIAYEAVHGLL